MAAAGPHVEVCSERGKRPSNQDATVEHRFADGRLLVAVADGMGGHPGGAVASRVALEALVAALEGGADPAAAVQAANAVVHDRAEADASLRGMGTTLLFLLQAGQSYHVGNVGDSRAYRIDAGGISQITADHSFAAEAVRSGELTVEDAARSPWRNALTRVVGGDPEVRGDVFGPYSAALPHRVVLCTDGVHKVLSDQEILESVGKADHAHGVAAALVDAALAGGSGDNVTLALITFDGSLPAGLDRSSEAFPLAEQPADRRVPHRAQRRMRRRRSGAWTPREVTIALLLLGAVLIYVTLLAVLT